MSDPADLIATSSDWRRSLQINNRKTFMIITVFIGIYVSIGILIDLAITTGRYPNASLDQLLINLVTFHLFPLATVIMLAVAVVSLLVTIAFSDQLMLMGTEYHEITPENAKDLAEKQFYNVVEEMKIAAGLTYMPKVYIIDADYMNAFASGYSEKSAMVAITRGLMQKLTRSEQQAVMAHEMSHVRHLDIKVTLMASVLSNLILMVLDMFFYNMLFSNRSDSENRNQNLIATALIILRYILPIINVLLLLYLSRTREYMADAGSVELLRDNAPLASALLKIQADNTQNQDKYAADYQQTPHENVRREAYIFDPVQAGLEPASSLSDIFSTHPNLQSRLTAIGFKLKK